MRADQLLRGTTDHFRKARVAFDDRVLAKNHDAVLRVLEQHPAAKCFKIRCRLRSGTTRWFPGDGYGMRFSCRLSSRGPIDSQGLLASIALTLSPFVQGDGAKRGQQDA